MSFFRADEYPPIDKWTESLTGDVGDYISFLYLDSLCHILKSKGIEIEDQETIFEQDIWSLYRCKKCGTTTVGIPDIKGGFHFMKEDDACGEMELVKANISWTEARARATEDGIYGCSIPILCIPIAADDKFIQETIGLLLAECDDMLESGLE